MNFDFYILLLFIMLWIPLYVLIHPKETLKDLIDILIYWWLKSYFRWKQLQQNLVIWKDKFLNILNKIV